MISVSVSKGNSIDKASPIYKRIADAHIRLAKKDPTIWGPRAQAEAAIRLNWVDLPERSRELLPILDAFCARRRDKKHIILCGMGGSSLAAEVIAATFGKELFILDSTDPNYVAHALAGDLSQSLVLVSSKSGATLETAAQRALFQGAFQSAGLLPQDHIVIVTDPNSPLDLQARSDGYPVINADPNMGGRFSALGAFGLLPATLLGIDVSILLDNALDTKLAFLDDSSQIINLAYLISIAGQYLTFTDAHSSTPGLSYWIEQLIAESTGKNQIGRLPVVVETHSDGNEGNPLKIAFAGSADIVVAGDLASQFILWEWVSALVAAALEIDPFNQPNVAEAKEQTSILLKEWGGVVPPDFSAQRTVSDIEIFGADSLLTEFVSKVPDGGYIAIMAYLDRRDDCEIEKLRKILAEKTGHPVTFGWGPRFLHSTGQFHKGGAPNGAFLQITGEVKSDISIPGVAYGFKTLIMAQVIGDGKALLSRSYPLQRLHLLRRKEGIAQLLKAAREL